MAAASGCENSLGKQDHVIAAVRRGRAPAAGGAGRGRGGWAGPGGHPRGMEGPGRAARTGPFVLALGSREGPHVEGARKKQVEKPKSNQVLGGVLRGVL